MTDTGTAETTVTETTSTESNAPDWNAAFADAVVEETKAKEPIPTVATTEAATSEQPKPTGQPATKTDAEVLADLRLAAQQGRMNDVEAALGIKGQHITSADFVALRKDKHKLDQMRQELNTVAAELEHKHAGFYQATKQMESGDVLGALQTVFGKPYDELAQMIIDQKTGTDPRVTQLSAEQRQLKEELERAKQERLKFEQESQTRAEQQRQIATVRQELQIADDVAKADVFPQFVQSLARTQLQHYEQTGVVLPLREVSTTILKQIQDHADGLVRFCRQMGYGVPQTLASTTGQPSDDRGTREQRTQLPQSRTATGESPRRPMTEKEEAEHWTSIFAESVAAERDSHRAA